MIDLQTEQRLVAGLVVLAILSAVVATAYLWRIHREVERGLRARLYGAIAWSATMVTAGALLVLWPAMLSLLDYPRLDAQFNLLLVGVGITLALAMPTYMADFIRRLRAGRRARSRARTEAKRE